MSRSALFVYLAAPALIAADGKQSQAKPESLSQEKFSEIHAPLLRPNRTQDAGQLTERVARSLPAPATAPGALARRNYVDQHIFAKMERDGVRPAPLTSDGEFLRRLSLDLTGRIPSSDTLREFLASTDPAKRDKAIDKLLESEEFVEKWAYFFMDLFRANGKMGRGQNLFHYWMKENLRVDRPYDETVRAIVAASAKSNHVVAASNLIAREHVQGKPQPDDGTDLGMVQQTDTHDELAVIYAQRFLGVNLSCVSCHDGKGHLEKVNVHLTGITRRQFYQNASFLGRSRYLMYWENGKPQSGEFLIDDHSAGYDTKGKSMIRVPRFGGPNNPAFFLTGEQPRPGEEPREALGRMITAHPQFARASANLFWARLMGVGIVDPYDEFDLARQDPRNLPKGWDAQPSHPELLDALATDFRRNGHSVKHLFRTIARSTAYQLSSRYEGEWNESRTRHFARKLVRQLSAEELHDAIATATSRPGEFKMGGEKMPMAMQVSGPAGSGDVKSFLSAFGQSNRSNPPKDPNGSPLQPLLMMQSPVVNDKVLAKKDSRVERLLASYPNDNAQVVDELFLATLSRLPSAEEKKVSLGSMAADRVRGAQNLQWALINQVEFIFNY
ncbi:MAG: DUF1549 domain-containing protein [Acidobacteria bacterium]|nr:DUF1549 domain-containing protein [Acidobacteriota bacterium]